MLQFQNVVLRSFTKTNTLPYLLPLSLSYLSSSLNSKSSSSSSSSFNSQLHLPLSFTKTFSSSTFQTHFLDLPPSLLAEGKVNKRDIGTSTSSLYELTSSHNGAVLKCTLHRSPNNVFSTNDLLEWDRDLETHFKNEKLRLFILESSVPGMFSLGLDPVFICSSTIPQRVDLFRSLLATFRRIYYAPVPTIARIEGAAYAGGAVFTLCCDERIMMNDAQLSFSEVKVGVPIPQALSQILKTCVVSSAFNELAILGRAVNAQTLHKWGYVTNVCTKKEEMDHFIADRLGKISRMSRDILTATLLESKMEAKKFLDQQVDVLGDVNSDGYKRFSLFLNDDYLGAGIKAYLENKPPKWKY